MTSDELKGDGPEQPADDEARAIDRLQHLLDLRRDALHRQAPAPGAQGLALRESAARIAAATASPAYQERLRVVEAARLVERVADLRVRALAAEAPEDEDLRVVAFDDRAPETPALRAFRAAVAWRGGRRRGCVRVVGGPRGVGKSAAMVHVLLRLEERARFVDAVTIGETPHNGWSANASTWERWLSVPVLAIDDLGTERSDAEGETIATLLWRRYDRGLLTLVTTNLARKPLAQRYLAGEIGARLADRLINAQGRATAEGKPGPGGLAWFVPAPGESLRNAARRAELLGRRGT